MAGCGIRGGAVYGESDKTASTPKSNPVTPQGLHATVLHALGAPLEPGKGAFEHPVPGQDGEALLGIAAADDLHAQGPGAEALLHPATQFVAGVAAVRPDVPDFSCL